MFVNDAFEKWKIDSFNRIKTVIHFDYDGTLAEWKNLVPEIKEKLIALGNSLESVEDIINTKEKLEKEVYEIIKRPSYYYDLMPYKNVTGFATLLHDKHYDTRLLTCVISEEAKADKDFWIGDFCPRTFGGSVENPDKYKEYKRIYVPDKDRAKKFSYIPDIMEEGKLHILIDDHTPNLIAFEEACRKNHVNGAAIKMFNGVNGTHGKWEGFSLSNDMAPEKMVEEFQTIERFIKLDHAIETYPGNKKALCDFFVDHYKRQSLTDNDIKEFVKQDKALIKSTAVKAEDEKVETNESENEDDYEV